MDWSFIVPYFFRRSHVTSNLAFHINFVQS
jgi:hypothetical protein